MQLFCLLVPLHGEVPAGGKCMLSVSANDDRVDSSGVLRNGPLVPSSTAGGREERDEGWSGSATEEGGGCCTAVAMQQTWFTSLGRQMMVSFRCRFGRLCSMPFPYMTRRSAHGHDITGLVPQHHLMNFAHIAAWRRGKTPT